MSVILTDIQEQIARQLNDHAESPRGVVQDTFYTWTLPHINSSLNTTLSFLYAYKPDLFSSIKCYTIKEESCLVDLKTECGNVLKLLGVNGSCDNIITRDPESMDLLPLLTRMCDVMIDDSLDFGKYEVQLISEGVFQFKTPLPEGTIIQYLCAVFEDIYNTPDIIFNEYRPLFVSMSCWLLLLTDNESRSNMERVPHYYAQVSDFLQTKLQIDFSLWATDYKDGIQLTPQSIKDQ